MCGIAGIFNFESTQSGEQSVRAMCGAIAHRGPDGEGFYGNESGPVWLGHRRLAILDLSEAGRQPMSDASGRYHITYNGEIYNFLELRADLEGFGERFRTGTDTEVILAAWRRWGPACQTRFNGMWAFAIWDEAEQRLFLSRDRFGIKPLFYHTDPGRFVFASELKAFRHLQGFTLRANENALRSVVSAPTFLESTEETLLEGVRRLPGGHSLEVRRGKVRVSRWWNTLDHLTEVPAKFPEQAEAFRELFLDSCRLRLRSDVPVATCLSGGLDSSAVLCSLAHIAGQNRPGTERMTENWQRAFVATFPGSPSDEERYARIAVEHAGANPRYRPMNPESAIDELERIILDFEEITSTLPAPIWSIYRELRREGVVVSLDGHGADEMLGGYTHYAQAALRTSGGIWRTPRRTLELTSILHSLYAPDGPVSAPPFWKLLAANDPLIRFLRRTSASNDDHPVENSPDPAEESAIDQLGPLNALLYRDFHRRMLPTILRNFDRCSMAHGIEVRMPFLDWRLVCFTFALPAESKIGGGFTKRILREAMRGIMPEALRTRKSKIGFNSPLPDWFNGPLRDWLATEVRQQDFLQSELWNGPAIRRLVDTKRSAKWTWHEAEQIWPALHTQLWRRIFLRQPR
ncbi:MAG: asparagine synthase (glutamine-hydrolyzing) [Blastocatellia bacterium]